MSEFSRSIIDAANAASDILIPNKSKAKYKKAYDAFCTWRLSNNIEIIDETVILAYFYEKVRGLMAI